MKYLILSWFILWFCINMLNDSLDLAINTAKYNCFIEVVLIITIFFQIILHFFKKLTMITLVTTVDFVQLTTGQQVQDTQLAAIQAVELELQASVQPALDHVTATQAQLVIDQQAITDAQAVLDAANAKLAADQVIADAAIVTYDFVAQDLTAWQAANADIKDDAANVEVMRDIYIRNGGVV